MSKQQSRKISTRLNEPSLLITIQEAHAKLGNLIEALTVRQAKLATAQQEGIHHIQCVCCSYFNVSFESLMSDCRKAAVVTCRDISIYLCRIKYPKVSSEDLGAMFNKERSSVSKALVRAGERSKDDIAIKNLRNALGL